MTGPTRTPGRLIQAMPPKTARKMSSGWMLVLPRSISGLTTLSVLAVSTMDHTATKTAQNGSPVTHSVMHSGTHTVAVPTIGMKLRAPVSSPRNTTRSMPAME